MNGGLLERESELARLAALIGAAGRGSGSLALIEGAPGIGKTHLLDRASRTAGERGMLVLRARGVALENEFAFGVVRQLFEGVLSNAATDERQNLLSGPAGLAGALFGWVPDEPPRPAADPGFVNLHGLYWLCFNLAARQPVMLAIDDLHWADAPSLRFVNFLAERLEGLRVLLAVALRPADPGPLLESIYNHPRAVVLAPSELSEPASRRLIAQTFGGQADPEFCRACVEVTGGNPFYLRALAEGLRADGVPPEAASSARVATQVPETVVRALVLRLSRLPRAAARLAKGLAVLGPDAEVRDAAQLAGIESGEAAECADALSRAGILADRRPLRFMHPIIQAAVYADLTPGERSQMHARAARGLSVAGASVERVAAHVLAAEPTGEPWNVQVLRDAADRAIAGGAPESAIRYLQRARREATSRDTAAALLLELGRAERLAGDPAALEHLEQALAAATEARARAVVAQELAAAMTFRDQFSEAVGVLEGAIADLGEIDLPLAQALEAQLLAAGALHLSTRPVQLEHLERIKPSDLGDTPTERMLLANIAQWTGTAGEPASTVLPIVERALAGGLLLTELTCDSQIFHCAIDALMWGDMLEPARYWFDQAMADAQTRGSLMGFLQTAALRSELFYRLGELAEAEADARAALDGGGGSRWVLAPVALQTLVSVLIERGQLSQAADLLAAYDVPSGLGQPGMTNWFLYAQGRLALATGEWEAAKTSFMSIGDWMTAWGERDPDLLDWRCGAAVAFARLGDLDRAHHLSWEVIELARSLGHTRSLGVGLQTAAAVAARPEATGLLREAVSILEQSPARLEHARALINLGAALRRQNQRREARDPLRQGVELALRCGASALSELGQSELIAAGARPRRSATRGVDALTPSELRVARLAANGHSTPGIAQQLFVTVNTVETHLRHVYLKLGVHSRAELPPELSARGLEPLTPDLPVAEAGRVAAQLAWESRR